MKKIKISILTITVFAALVFITSCNSGPKMALIETSYGDIKVELYDSTPKHRDNFVKLVNQGFYNDLLFHRVIKGFMIQGGDPDSRGAAPGARLGVGGPGYQVDAEIGAPHIKGTLAAASNGNPEKRSSGSQFYLVQGMPQTDAMLDRWQNMYGITYNETQRNLYKEKGGRPDLDTKYTVFGEVVEGLDVVDKIAVVQTGQADRPVQDVTMKIKMLN